VALAALATCKPPVAAAVKAATAGLDDAERAIRLKSLTALAAWKEASAPAAARLTAMMGDEEYGMAEAACGVLTAIGPAAEPAMPALVEAFRKSRPALHVRAGLALTAIGAAAIPAVVALLDDTDRAAGTRSISLLAALGPKAKVAAPALQRQLKGMHWSSAAGALLAIDPGQEQVVFDAVATRLAEPDAVAEAAPLMVRMAGGGSDMKRRLAVVNALAGEISVQSKKELTPARRACIRTLLSSLSQLGTAAASAEPILRQVGANPDLFQAVGEVWPKIVPGKPLTPPVPDMDEAK
jgi:hypothetical protein